MENRNRIASRLTHLLLLLGLVPGSSLAQGGSNCAPNSPKLSGQTVVQAGQSYSVSWTNVLTGTLTASDYYWLERSTDSGFGASVDRIKTTRPALTLPPGPAGASMLYHRVIVSSSCPTVGFAAIVSNVLAVQVRSSCPEPEPVGDITASPENPPALTTYVVSWDTSGTGPGPGGGPTGLTYRLRRTSPYDSRESVSASGSASFTDPPGEYVYQVRAEASCGAASAWSNPKKVVVGKTSPAALVLLSEAKAIAVINPDSLPTTTFVVRNGGTSALRIRTIVGEDRVTVSPQEFTIGPNEVQSLTAVVNAQGSLLSPIHTWVELHSEEASLRVPIDAMVGREAADVPVTWSDPDLDVDASGSSVLRSVVNSGKTIASIVSTTNQPWLAVEPVDQQTWDRPLQPGESRLVRITIDRARRRATTGTEVGVVTISTVGHPAESQSLVVIDDGPPLPIAPGVRPPAAGMKTRLLYAAMPNTKDAVGAGRFTSDLWLTNLDSVSPIDVMLFFTPVGAGFTSADTRRVDLQLAAGETRRYRNVVGNVLGFEGACELEVRSPAPTLSATALVNNSPFAQGSRRATLGTTGATATGSAQYGFEERPTTPGEGVKATDAEFVLSGLAHDVKRRTNLLLTETSGFDTTIQVELYQSNGNPVTRAGNPVTSLVTVPALGTVQLNDADVFLNVAPLAPGAPYALILFQSGYTDAANVVHGSVVPFATVIDSGTEDASFRVGVSTRALNPVPARSTTPPSTANAPAGPGPESGIPFGGGAAPLLFPVAHLRGAPLGNGEKPFWKTRVIFTNVSETEPRKLLVSFIDQNGGAHQDAFFFLGPKTTATVDDLLEEAFQVTVEEPLYGSVRIQNAKIGSNDYTWADVDVQTETYTLDPVDSNRGQYSTGMEGVSYLHGYSSFQSNLGTVQIEGAESSSRYRTNLILEEVGGAACTVAVSAYLPGSFVPIATASVVVPPFGYLSKELFKSLLGLDLSELTDVRVVVRQIDGDGVFMAFASKINLATGDPANIFLRPASAGTGR